jgi:hypothetical protein
MALVLVPPKIAIKMLLQVPDAEQQKREQPDAGELFIHGKMLALQKDQYLWITITTRRDRGWRFRNTGGMCRR